MNERPKKTFLQGRYTAGQQVHAKTVNSVNDQRNTSQKYNEVSHQSEWALSKKSANNKCWRGEDVEKRELLVGMQIGTTTMENRLKVP